MTVTLRSLSVATEPSFGCLDATGTPDASALSFISLACERDPVVIFGDPAFTTKNETRESFTGQPLEPDTMWRNGERVPRRTGTVSVRMDITTLGASTELNYDNTGIGKLLNAGFKSFKPALNGGQATTFTTANRFTDDGGNNADYEVGMLLGYANAGGIAEYTAVTSKENGVSQFQTISPALTVNSGAATLFPMQTWFMGVRNESGQTEDSVVFDVSGPGFKTLCYGCKLQSVAFSLDGGRIMADFTFLSAYIIDDHENAANNFPSEPQPLSGPTQHFRGAHVVLSDALGDYSRGTKTGVGLELDRNQFDIENFSLTYTNTLTPKAHSYSILTMSDMEITNTTVEASFTATYLPGQHDFMYNDFKDKVVRSLMIGSGPVFDGAGFCLYLAGAFLTTDPRKLDVSGEIVKQTLTYNLARFGGDVNTAGTADIPSLSPFRLGLGV